MFKTKNFWYITLFIILYLITAGSSFFHAISFFGLANNSWMSIILAFAFEIGQAAVLFSLLTSVKDRKRIMPWVLMSMFTLVQVVGNVFSSYKHIILNSIEDLRFFKEPIFIWTNLPDQEATVMVTWAIGAILPVCALFLTSMITNYLTDQEELKKIENKDGQQEEKSNNDNGQQSMETFGDSEGTESKDNSKDKEIEELKEKLKIHEENPLINKYSILQMENQGLEESNKKKDEQIEDLKKQLESRVENLHGVENSNDQFIKEKEEEIENLNKRIEEVELDHDKMVDEKFATEKKFNDLLEDYNEQQNEYSKLKQELEELKKSKEDDKEQEKQIESLNIPQEQVEDLIKNGIKQDKLKESHFIN